ncbi:hypothetical protein ACFU7Y_27995 [Kitasatospora sp. NPDC057542]|nr:hypothetical protein [Streptomyces sp. LS1784]
MASSRTHPARLTRLGEHVVHRVLPLPLPLVLVPDGHLVHPDGHVRHDR